MNSNIKKLLLGLISVFLMISLHASSENIIHEKLENGLEIFINKNNNTPLVSIELCFRAGSSYQNEETEGIFHLYEHMLFKGNSLYKNSSAISEAITDLGASNYNGSTGHDFVNYYFTIPSYRFEKGLEFWAAAVTSPKFDEKELEEEKKVVLSEISAYRYNKSQKLMLTYCEKLFGNTKCTFTPSGSEETVSNCTVEKLKQMKQDFYCPDNCAIFITGDVDENQAISLVEKYFASWKKSENQEYKKALQINAEKEKTLTENQYLLCTGPNYKASMMIIYNGPESCKNQKDIYGADLLLSILNDSNYKFPKKIKGLKNSKNQKIVEEFATSYLTSLLNGTFSFGFDLERFNDDLSLSVKIIENCLFEEISKMAKEKYFSEKQIAKTKSNLEDRTILDYENPNNQTYGLRFYWAVCDTYYALSYDEKMQETSIEDLVAFVNNYLKDKNYVCVLMLNDSAYKDQIEALKQIGFEEVE